MICSLVAALALSAAPTAPGDNTARDLREVLEACARYGFSGAVLCSKGGKVVLAEGYGLANREEGTPNGPDTLFEIASCTKPFTAIAVLQLAAEGKLGLDDSIADHLPGVPEDKAGITVRHLLTHTSGVPRSSDRGRGDDLKAAVTAYLTTHAQPPGTVHEYWNGGYALLAGIVETVSGESYVDRVRSRILEPAGMESSGFTGEARLARLPVATGYERDKKPRRADEHPYDSYGWQYRGMGGLVTTVGDLLRFHEALRDDTLLDDEWREVLLAPGKGDYACGFYVTNRGRRVVSHGGDVRGFHAKLSFFPDDDAAIVVLCNVGDVPTWIVTAHLQAILLGDGTGHPSPPRPDKQDLRGLEKLAGRYESEAGEAVELRVDGEGLVLSAVGAETTRHLAGPHTGYAGQRPPERVSPELIGLARKIVQAVAEGDPEPLRRAMREGIPETWPGHVVTQFWPAHEREWGRLREVRLAGALVTGSVTKVLLELDHAKGRPRVEVRFMKGELTYLSLDGPETFAELRYVRQGDRLVGFDWLGRPPAPIELVEARRGKPAVLRVPGNLGFVQFTRVD